MATRQEILQRRAFEACIPLNVTFELTLRCNLRCAHCYNFDRDLSYAPGRTHEDELADAEIHRILDELHEEGCLYLAFTGGEALVHPSIDDFIRHACQAGMAVRIKSNGTLLDRARVERMAKAGVSAVDISLYGASADVHDAFVNLPGAFDRTIGGAQAARDVGLEVRFSFILAQKNADHIERMIDLASAMNIPYAVDAQITGRYDGSRSSLELQIDHAALEQLYRGPLKPLISGVSNTPDSPQCACARSVCGISAFGDVYPCIGAPLPSGNLRAQSFPEIWRNSPQFKWIRGLATDDFSACRSCHHLSFCRRSSGVIYTNTGLYTGPEKFGGDWVCGEAEIIHRIHDEQDA